MSNKKGSNSIFFIFVILILLPSVFLIPITNMIIDKDVLHSLVFEKISAVIGSISVIFGILAIYRQIEKDKKVNSSRFLVDLNDSLMSFESTSAVYRKLLYLEDKKISEKEFKKFFKDDYDRYDILEYLGFFENLQFFLEKNILKISEINNMFSKRFFMAVNNPFIQDEIKKNANSLLNIYKFSKSLIQYRLDHGLDIPYGKYSISKTYNYDKYADKYYNYRSISNNAFLIFILSSIVFMVLLFFILIFLNYPISNISSIVSTFGTIIGAFSILFQLNAENNINKSRFIFDLNKSFISKKAYKNVYVAAFKNINKTDFSGVNNISKKIDKYDLFNYLTFFESINVMIENRALKISEMVLIFNSRFFSVINNKFVQEFLLIKDSKYFRNIYRLHFKFTKYKKDHNESIIYENQSLDKNDKNYFNLIKNDKKAK